MKVLSRKSPWYVAGLAFECTACGRCCAGPDEGYVWITPPEIAAVAAHLGLTDQQVHRKYVRKVGRRYSLVEDLNTKDCVFLTAGDGSGRRCRIYPVRPVQCRTWPFWPDNLTDPDAWSLAGLRCKGINRGQPYGPEEIERMRDATPR